MSQGGRGPWKENVTSSDVQSLCLALGAQAYQHFKLSLGAQLGLGSGLTWPKPKLCYGKTKQGGETL